MATKHICDRCGNEVKSRDEFWIVELSPVDKVRRESKGNYTRMELCPKCKTHIFVELHQGK